MFHTALISAYASIIEHKIEQEKERKWLKEISIFPENVQVELKEKRRLEQREDRMHEELCSAIRNSKSEVNIRY